MRKKFHRLVPSQRATFKAHSSLMMVGLEDYERKKKKTLVSTLLDHNNTKLFNTPTETDNSVKESCVILLLDSDV